MRFPVVIYEEETGGLSVICPSLPGCHSQGETIKEALANIREAIDLCLEVMAEDGTPVPTAREPVIASVEIERRAKVS
ncbi:MAG: type II toxin-antitoxin system HicB family antitoxin [Armatimonadota bacterium]